MIAAVAALRQLGAGRIVVAAPVIARSTFYLIHNAADEVAAVIAPEEFYGVGQWYEDFSQTTDEEVQALLAETNNHDPSRRGLTTDRQRLAQSVDRYPAKNCAVLRKIREACLAAAAVESV